MKVGSLWLLSLLVLLLLGTLLGRFGCVIRWRYIRSLGRRSSLNALRREQVCRQQALVIAKIYGHKHYNGNRNKCKQSTEAITSNALCTTLSIGNIL